MSSLSDQDLKAVIGIVRSQEGRLQHREAGEAEALNRGIAGSHEPENVIFNHSIIGTVSATTGGRVI